ncbi:organic cation transporter-like protein [Culex quinquefasciatus]|uniref:organic cation transporter-like protein n=1 Tax=Culex quinquefasciatus TaxID=7176 RepID=UPI0018E2E89A|nr:organic cation transporter-like protein [Culex quinquefasciatus]
MAEQRFFLHLQHFKNSDVKPWIKPGHGSKIIPCDTFEHHAEYQSIITQFDLVCSRDILVATTQFFHLFGVLLGGIITTKLLETISPRNTMLLGMYAQILCGCITGLVDVFELHMMFRCLSAICCGLMYTAGGVIMSDITGGKHRTATICLFEQFWSVGVMLLPGIASFWQSWSQLYLAISLPTFILIILHRWIPDSPNWLLEHGRIMEAKSVLIESTKINKNTFLQNDIDLQLKTASQAEMDKVSEGWWMIWKEKTAIKNLLRVHLAWSIFIVVYYGMLLNIRAFGRDHLTMNTIIAGACEMIGTFGGLYLIICSNKKWFWCGLLNIAGGLIAYIAWIIPTNISENQRVMLLMLTAMVSKATISVALSILTTCTTELVSQPMKKGAAYSATVWARIWLLGAPFIGATIIFGQLIPQTAFGSLTIIGGIIIGGIHSPRTHPLAKKRHFTKNLFALQKLTGK